VAKRFGIANIRGARRAGAQETGKGESRNNEGRKL
jgi:hypothetical protein